MNFEQAKEEIREILDSVNIEDIPEPVIPSKPTGDKQWYNDEDGCSMRMSYAAPLQQVYSFNCSSYSVRQVIWALLGLDLSDQQMADYFIGQGWLHHDGAGHDELAKMLDYSSGGRLGITWKNLQEVGYNGLDDICNDPDRAVIIHSSITCSDGRYGHYWVLKKVCLRKETLVELRSICGAMENNSISFNDFQSKISWISQPSIGVVYRK
jgi:hypothetical protein